MAAGIPVYKLVRTLAHIYVYRLDVKAYKVKVVLRFLNVQCNKYFRRLARVGAPNDDLRTARLVATCTYSLNAFAHAMDRDFAHPSPEQIDHAQRVGETFLASYSALARHFLEQRRLLFKLRQKLHYLEHIILDQYPLLNPRACQNWLDEDWVGKVMRTAGMTHPLSMPISTLLRLRLGYASVWNQLRQ